MFRMERSVGRGGEMATVRASQGVPFNAGTVLIVKIQQTASGAATPSSPEKRDPFDELRVPSLSRDEGVASPG